MKYDLISRYKNMPENIKIGIIGGDGRLLVVANRLSEMFECAVWGFDSVYGTGGEKYLENTVKCTDWESAVKCSDAVILPLPASHDGVHLNCPLAAKDSSSAVPLEDIFHRLPPTSLLLGGRIPPSIKRLAAELAISLYDYYDSEELQIKNSVPTAEGAISACISNLPITVHGMRAAVVGYGRVGRTLAGRLIALGATVFAVARSVRDLSWAKCDGCIPVPLDDYRELPIICDAIFNTVPYPIFDRALLEKISRDSVMFELASGGISIEAASSLGIKTVALPALPGKTSPVTSGEIICGAICSKLKNYFEERTCE